ncbi:acyl-coenzyme A synthetase ACSM3, mitochondrial [Caerostris extrusa]|uniref:Acyl-coenzyme A synthetase ACSM3, mitochondrial n=1 Tax=Caerostris extrusa TaxID=172846 RepID=A0AAV4MM41_CAEEX|nr:acyl-coenzyme A synthetase ACSM3, mitochondrial [Caerostris extrusa]
MYKCIEYKPGSLGKPSPALDIVILDENENELGPGVTGEIALKKRDGKIFGSFMGYKDEPEKTRKSLTENYFHTGDIAYYDKDGYFWFVGRNDDLINSAGYRIGPFEVESALMEHPAVVEVAVTSSPDEERGEVVKAFIVLKNFPSVRRIEISTD